MRRGILTSGFIAAALTLGFGLGTAEAFTGAPNLAAMPESLLTPAAMCGRSCAGGGRHIPGPPGVCRDHGLRYCGPSRGPAVVVPLPGADVVVGPRRREHCRTVTVQRPNGTVRTTRECR
jgi:hypothetical protein